MADASLYQKNIKSNKEKYRPISKLPNISKVFERMMQDNISSFVSDKLPAKLSGFRSRYSTQQALLAIIDIEILKFSKSLLMLNAGRLNQQPVSFMKCQSNH